MVLKATGEEKGKGKAADERRRRSSILALFIGGFTIHKMRLIKIGKGTVDLELLLSLTRMCD